MSKYDGILEVDDDCLHHFRLHLEMTQVEQPPVKPVFKLVATREPMSNKKKGWNVGRW